MAVGLGVGLGVSWFKNTTKTSSHYNRARRNVKIRRRTHNESDMDPSDSADNLDDEQLEKVAKFISQQTGGISTERAIQILKENHWNIEAANKSLKEELPGNSAVLANTRRGWISSIWNYGYSFVASFLAPPPEMDPQAAAAKFLRDFETAYGNKHPSFIQNSFQQAAQQAKREYKFLVVYLHSKNHQDTDHFCRETLGTEVITDFINENFLSWAGDLSNAEPFKLSTVLGAAAFPFIAVITNNNIGGMTILDRIEGSPDPDTLMLRLSIVLEHHGPLLMQAKIEHEEREADRRIRDEQDRAFRQSLAEDEEKQRKAIEEERKQREEGERIQKEEQLRKRKLEEKQKRKERLRQSLPPEPELSDGVSQLVIRLTDGSRIQRRFKKTDTLGNVFDFVDSSPSEINGEYDLVTNFPRRVFSERTMTLEQAGLYPHGALFVQEK